MRCVTPVRSCAVCPRRARRLCQPRVSARKDNPGGGWPCGGAAAPAAVRQFPESILCASATASAMPVKAGPIPVLFGPGTGPSAELVRCRGRRFWWARARAWRPTPQWAGRWRLAGRVVAGVDQVCCSRCSITPRKITGRSGTISGRPRTVRPRRDGPGRSIHTWDSPEVGPDDTHASGTGNGHGAGAAGPAGADTRSMAGAPGGT